MRHLQNSPNLLTAVSGGLLLALSLGAACTTGAKRSRFEGHLETCLTDVPNASVHCDGTTYPMSRMRDYVCHPRDQYEKFIETLE